MLEALRTDLVDIDPKPFDVCIVGHVTRDVIRSGDARRSGAGGVAYYASLALHRLGRRVAVITKMAKEDREELLSELEREGITVFSGDSTETTVFDNEYCEGNLDSRVQTVTSVAEPFTSSDLGSVSARWFYLGPLLSCDMSVEFVETVEKRGKVALDAQGLIRKIEGKEIHSVRPAETKELIGPVSLLKVDADEAATLSEANGREDAARRLHAFGPQEVILTFGSKGSMIFENGRFYVIDPIAGKEVDATGCGDTYLAAYLDRRLASNDPGFSGRFAAAAATLALEQEGAFCAGAPEVYTHMRITDTTPRS